jgi:hypothetical protein
MPVRRQWAKPTPLGAAAAVESLSGVAAPLLAGFGLAAITVVAQAPERLRWPGLSMIALAGAVVLLMFSVQAGYLARTFLYSPGDLDDWWPDHRDDDHRQWLHETHEADFDRWRVWSTRSRRGYNIGSLTLTLALATIVAPPAGAQEATLRWVGAAVPLIATVFIILSAADRMDVIRWRRRQRRSR